MKLSYNWLKEFVDIKVSPQRLADDLSLFGHNVESIKRIGDDWILDLEITPNRGDCLSVLGIARETASLYNLKLKQADIPIQSCIGEFAELTKNIKVEITEPRICSRFTTRVIDNIKVGDSPKWIRNRLKLYGFRSINNIVDITNYVMIETGQPLHAFDYDKLKVDQCGSEALDFARGRRGLARMIIRRAKKGESVVTLDGLRRYLDENAIVIENNSRLIDLAGIMGGFNSDIDKNTKTIILQAAVFDSVLIRRTSKCLKLVSDASYRYERGVDPQGSILGSNRAAELIQKLYPRAKFGDLIDIQSKKIQPTKIKFNPDQINKLLGTKIAARGMIKYLNRLGFQTLSSYTSTTLQLSAVVPSYRLHDIKIWQDVAEEVARIHGYNKLGEDKIDKTKAKDNHEYDKKEALKNLLVENGFTEVYSYSFIDEKLSALLKINLTQCRQVINSVAPELRYLRPDLRPSILTTVSKNPWAPEVKIFEVGHVFNNNLEKEQLAIAITGKSDHELKRVSKLLNIRSEIKSFDQNILDHLKIRRSIKYLLYNLEDIKIKPHHFNDKFLPTKYKQVSEFPPTIRDLAFIVNTSINSQKVHQLIKQLDPHILFVELFDEFASDKFGKNKKNIAFHIWLQDLKGPMKNTSVDIIIKKTIKIIETKYKAKLRG